MLLNPNETFFSLWSGALRTAICVIIQRENFARKTVSQSHLGNYFLRFIDSASKIEHKKPWQFAVAIQTETLIIHTSETKNHNNNVMHIVVAENNIFAVRLQKRARECSLRFMWYPFMEITLQLILNFFIAVWNCTWSELLHPIRMKTKHNNSGG